MGLNIFLKAYKTDDAYCLELCTEMLTHYWEIVGTVNTIKKFSYVFLLTFNQYCHPSTKNNMLYIFAHLAPKTMKIFKYIFCSLILQII